MTSAFISYSSKDRPVAKFVASNLESLGVNVFIDYEKLKSGDFMSQLGHEIKNRDYLVVLISEHSVKSKWVRYEVGSALRNKYDKFIIPVILQEVALTDMFPLEMIQQVDFSRWNVDGNMGQALKDLARLMKLKPRLQSTLSKTNQDQDLLTSQEHDEIILDENEIERPESPTYEIGEKSEIFQAALAVQYSDPERALFLYQLILDNDPDYMDGKIGEFVATQRDRTKSDRLYLLEEKAKLVKSTGQWKQLHLLVQSMLELNPNDSFAKEHLQIAEKNFHCEPFYKQAHSAKQNGNLAAVSQLMTYIDESCPDYGDPAGLLINQPITCQNLGFLRTSHVLGGHTGPIQQVVFSPSGSMLATISADETVKIWSVASGAMIKEFGHPATTLSFSPDETYIAVATHFRSVAIVGVSGWETLKAYVDEPRSNCTALVFSHDSNLLISGWGDGSLKAHCVPNVTEISKTISERGTVESLALLSNGLLFANFIGRERMHRRVLAWRLHNWDSVKISAFDNRNSSVVRTNMEVSSDGRFLTCFENQSVVVRVLPQGWEDWKFHQYGTMPPVNDFALSPIDSFLVILAGENTDRRRMLFYDRVADKRIGEIEGHNDVINTIDVSQDGRFIATGSDDCTAKIWQL